MANLIDEIFDKQAVVDQLAEIQGIINDGMQKIVDSAPKLKTPIDYVTALQALNEADQKSTEVTKLKTKALDDLAKAYVQADKAMDASINLENEEFQEVTKLTNEYKERAKEQKQLLELERVRQQTMKNSAQLLSRQAQSEGELRKQTAELIKAQQSLRVTNVEENKVRQALIEKINANKVALKGMTDEVSKQRDNVGNYKSALEGVVSGQMNLREAMALTRKELQQLEVLQAQGNELSAEQKKRYNDLNEALGQMKDIQGDISARTKILADDYRGMTAAMESVKLGVNIVTSLKAVTALLGDENEELAKTMAQIVAIQQTLNTITQIQNQLNKDGIIQTNLRMLAERDLTNATVAQTAATKASIVAMKTLQALQKAGKGIIGVFGAALFGMVKMIKEVVGNTEKAREEQEKQNQTLKDAQDETLLYKEEMQRLVVELGNYRDVLNEIADAYTTAGQKANIFQRQSVTQLAMNALLKEYNKYLEEYAALALKISQYPGYYEGRKQDEERLGQLYGMVKDLGEEAAAVGRNVGGAMSDSEKKISRFQDLMSAVADVVEKVNAKSKELAETTKKTTENNKEEAKSITEVVEAKEEELELDDSWFRSAVSNLQRVNEKRKESQQIWTDLHEENKSVIKDAEDALNRACEEAIEALKAVDEQQRRSAEETKKAWEERKESTMSALNNMNDAAQIIGQQENDRLDQQMSDFEDYYARRKNIIENTVMDEASKNRKLQNLENEKVAKERQIAKQRAEIQRRQAIFQNAVDSATAMSKAISSVGLLLVKETEGDTYSAIARYIAAIAAGVSAVATVASLISKILQIPAFEKGGVAEADKPFIAGEKGREIGFGQRTGKVYDFAQPMIFKANEPIRIHNAQETKQIVNNEYNKDVTLRNEVVVNVIDNKRVQKYFKIGGKA